MTTTQPLSAQAVAYAERRGQIEDYFDRTALKAWEQLTSTAPVGRIRSSVRAGRDRMRSQLLAWLPADLRGMRLLDAGCGTGALALEAARRGAEVLAIDLSPSLVALARDRVAALPEAATLAGRIDWRSGDMLDAGLGSFDQVVAMDSLIHYDAADMVRVLAAWSQRCSGSMLFTFVPRNPLLVVMRASGRLFPRANRAPWVEPVAEAALRQQLQAALPDWTLPDTQRIKSGFYTSQAVAMTKSAPALQGSAR